MWALKIKTLPTVAFCAAIIFVSAIVAGNKG